MIEQEAQVCPLCGADQTKPVKFVDANLPQPPTAKSVAREWGLAIVVLAAFAGGIAGILLHNLGWQSTTPAAEAAEIAAKSLRDIREALSTYALFAKDEYPATLDALGGVTSAPKEAALNAEYKLVYSLQPPSNDGAHRSFVLLARPEKNNYLNLYIDESGMVRATTENRPATGEDPPY
jgi:hypothetical protein